MDDTDPLIEELRQLTPAAPSAVLTRRLAAELARPARRTGLRWWLLGLGLPAAAAIAMLCAVWSNHRATVGPRTAATPAPPASPATDVFTPVTAENVLYAATDDGLATLPDGRAVRRERLQYIDTITWVNPRTHASLTWSIPREEVRVVPVRYE
ncbi:MAG TPA: hypothetical protein VHE61_14485 [Opitutaceae bacterium]|nr:hypothetical protein [Opitutaceae bacterium]